MNQDYMKRLREPFAFKDVEWKVQVTTQDKTRGMAEAFENELITTVTVNEAA